MCQKFGYGISSTPFSGQIEPLRQTDPMARASSSREAAISGRPPSASSLPEIADVVIEPIMTPLLTAARHQRLNILTGNAILRFQLGL